MEGCSRGQRILAEYMLMQPLEETPAAPPQAAATPSAPPHPAPPGAEVGGPAGPEPTRFGDWERRGRCIDF
jgi:hypothetical protein